MSVARRESDTAWFSTGVLLRPSPLDLDDPRQPAPLWTSSGSGGLEARYADRRRHHRIAGVILIRARAQLGDELGELSRDRESLVLENRLQLRERLLLGGSR